MIRTAELIVGLQNTLQQLGSILKRIDRDRRRELIGVRRMIIQQLWELKRHASGPECRIDPVLKQELAKRAWAIWEEIALVQATWPAATIDQYADEHHAATRKTKAAVDEFFQWVDRHFPPATSGMQELRKVS